MNPLKIIIPLFLIFGIFITGYFVVDRILQKKNLNNYNIELCGDGTCDEVEKKTGRCPQDCKENGGILPNDGTLPACGNNICEPEEENNCPSDCETTPLQNEFLMGFMDIGANNVLGEKEIYYIKELGARGNRSAFWYMDNNFIEMGSSPTDLINNGIELIAGIQPMPPGPPNNYSVFENKLRDLVNKYKEKIKYWQVGNEPDLAWQKRGYDANDYTTFFIKTSEIIKENCRDCKIVLAGISNQYDSGDNYNFYKEILGGIKQESAESKPFDVFDVHIYTDDSNYKKTSKAVVDYKNLLKKTGYNYEIEFVSTEFGTYSGRPKISGVDAPTQTEKFQAQMLIKLFVEFFASGITKAFWADIINNYKFGVNKAEGGYFDLTGLIYNGKGSYDLENNIKSETKKESFYSYKTLASKIQDKNEVQKINEDIYKFSKDYKVVYVAWSDTAAKLPASVTGEIKITDYLGNEKIQNASDIILNENPIFFEF